MLIVTNYPAGESGKIQIVTNNKKKKVETRIQRQVLLEDGKIIADSGPQVVSRIFEDSKTENEEKTRGGSIPHQITHPDHPSPDHHPISSSPSSPAPGHRALSPKQQQQQLIPLESEPVIRETSTISRTEKSASREVFHYSDQEIKELTEASDYAKAQKDPNELLEPMDNVILNAIKGKLKFYSNKSKKLIQKDKITEKARLDQNGHVRIQTIQSREEEHFSDEEVPEQYASCMNAGARYSRGHVKTPYDYDDDDDGVQIKSYMDSLDRRRIRYASGSSSPNGFRSRSTSRLAVGYEPIVVDIPTSSSPEPDRFRQKDNLDRKKYDWNFTNKIHPENTSCVTLPRNHHRKSDHNGTSSIHRVEKKRTSSPYGNGLHTMTRSSRLASSSLVPTDTNWTIERGKNEPNGTSDLLYVTRREARLTSHPDARSRTSSFGSASINGYNNKLKDNNTFSNDFEPSRKKGETTNGQMHVAWMPTEKEITRRIRTTSNTGSVQSPSFRADSDGDDADILSHRMERGDTWDTPSLDPMIRGKMRSNKISSRVLTPYHHAANPGDSLNSNGGRSSSLHHAILMTPEDAGSDHDHHQNPDAVSSSSPWLTKEPVSLLYNDDQQLSLSL